MRRLADDASRRIIPSISVRLISGGGGGSICGAVGPGDVIGAAGCGSSTCSRMAANTFFAKRARSAWSGGSPSRRRLIQSGISLNTTVLPMSSCTVSGSEIDTRTAIRTM